MFQLTPADKDIISKQNIVQRMQVSEKDPFMNKPKTIWRGFHKPISSTNELMASLEPWETRKMTEGGIMERYQDQEKRYYRNDEEI